MHLKASYRHVLAMLKVYWDLKTASRGFSNIFPIHILGQNYMTFHNISETSNNEHDYALKYLNDLHHNRSTLGTLDMSSQFHQKQ